MKILGITNTNFTAKPIRIGAEENKNIKFLYKTIMESTAVGSEFHPGQVIYSMGKENKITVHNPIEGFKEFLEKLGIKFKEIEE